MNLNRLWISPEKKSPKNCGLASIEYAYKRENSSRPVNGQSILPKTFYLTYSTPSISWLIEWPWLEKNTRNWGLPSTFFLMRSRNKRMFSYWLWNVTHHKFEIQVWQPIWVISRTLQTHYRNHQNSKLPASWSASKFSRFSVNQRPDEIPSIPWTPSAKFR